MYDRKLPLSKAFSKAVYYSFRSRDCSKGDACKPANQWKQLGWNLYTRCKGKTYPADSEVHMNIEGY